jgi:hypothetical protein
MSTPSRDTVRVRSIVISFLTSEGEETVRTNVVEDFDCDAVKDF